MICPECADYVGGPLVRNCVVCGGMGFVRDDLIGATADVPEVVKLVAGDLEGVDIEHLKLADGRCVISLNGQGHLPCAEHSCAHELRCCTEHGTHSMPHMGCILR